MRQIKLCAHQAPDHKRRCRVVDGFHGTDNRIALLEHGVREYEFKLAGGIAHRNLKCLHAVMISGKSGRQPCKAFLPLVNMMRHIECICGSRSVFRQNRSGIDAEVACIETGKLQWQSVRGILRFFAVRPRGKGGMPLADFLRDKPLLSENFSSEMQVNQTLIGIDIKGAGEFCTR